MTQLILGSQSPRRKEILGYFSLPFIQMTSFFEEEKVEFNGDPEKFVNTISQGKAVALSSQFPDAIILTADTAVFFNGKIYGKPKDEEEAFRSFKELVGNWHTVYTGVTVSKGNALHVQAEATHVLFNALTDQQIRNYIAHTDWRDKAGGYAIQMAGGLIVKKIDGCYYNVMGLPINTVEKLLTKVGVELWDYL